MSASSNYLQLDCKRSAKDTSGFKSSPCSPVHAVVKAFRVHPANASRRVIHSLRNAIHVVIGLASATLREIFDEAPYHRFLIRNHQNASAQSYAAFRRDHEALTVRRPRCC